MNRYVFSDGEDERAFVYPLVWSLPHLAEIGSLLFDVARVDEERFGWLRARLAGAQEMRVGDARVALRGIEESPVPPPTLLPFSSRAVCASCGADTPLDGWRTSEYEWFCASCVSPAASRTTCLVEVGDVRSRLSTLRSAPPSLLGVALLAELLYACRGPSYTALTGCVVRARKESDELRIGPIRVRVESCDLQLPYRPTHHPRLCASCGARTEGGLISVRHSSTLCTTCAPLPPRRGSWSWPRAERRGYVYRIDTPDGSYVGTTSSQPTGTAPCESRWRRHVEQAAHSAFAIQRALRRHGSAASFRILESGDARYARFAETRWIIRLGTAIPAGLNIADCPTSCAARLAEDEARLHYFRTAVIVGEDGAGNSSELAARLSVRAADIVRRVLRREGLRFAGPDFERIEPTVHPRAAELRVRALARARSEAALRAFRSTRPRRPAPAPRPLLLSEEERERQRAATRSAILSFRERNTLPPRAERDAR